MPAALLQLELAVCLAASGSWRAEQVSQRVPAASARVLAYVPAGCTRERRCPLVLCLHGWDDRPESLRDRTELATLADRYGLVLALPAMGRSVYEAAFYPETRAPWGAVPGARWIGEVVLPQMRERLPVLADRAHTGVLGLSTGGRGAIVVSERYAEFAAAASLSGTYDLSLLEPKTGEYKIHAAVFGEREAFGERWASEDCPSFSKLRALRPVSLFIGHGALDPAVPVGQAQAFAEVLRAGGHPALELVLEPASGHDFAYWNRALPWAVEGIARRLGAEARLP